MNRLFRKFLFSSICTSISIVFFLSPLQTVGQTIEIEGEKIDYIMPSAEAAALIKSVERPASLTNGIPDISIPLYSIPKTPISLKLNYNASGLMANELPSTSGLGWRLETGGMITRVVVGIPDDYPAGYLNRASSINELSSKLLNQYSQSDMSTIQSIWANSYDDSPDIFYYDILGQKGKFVLDRNYEALCFPRNNFKISYKKNSTNRIDSIFVKLPDGIIVNFSKNETCTVSGYSPISSSFTSSWSISTIESKDQVIALYEYNENNQSYTYNNLKAEEVKVLNSPSTQFNKVLKYNVVYVTNLLAKIKTYDTKVSFLYNTSQVNFGAISNSTWKSLREVVVNFENHINGTTSPVLLDYKYKFTYNITGTPPFRRNQFELTKLSVAAPGVELPYTFNYFDGDLPSLGTTSIDLWGYYNGASNGGTIIPSIYNVNDQLTSIPLISQTPLYSGATRTSNLMATRIGTLQYILSPEGLKTEYDYELNSFRLNGIVVNGGGLRIKSIFKYEDEKLIHQENFSYLPENPEQQTSGVLLYHTAPAIGMRYENIPLSKTNFSSFEVYTKASFNGYGSIPFLKPVYYTNVSVRNGETGSVYYKFGLPVDKSESGILPSNLSWANSGNNVSSFSAGQNRWLLYNEADVLSPSLFHLWTSPLLKSVIVKNQSGITVKTTNYTYGPLEKHRMVSTLKLLPRITFSSESTGGDIIISHDELIDQIVDDLPLTRIFSHTSKSYILSAWRELLSQTETVYNPLGESGISNTKYFEYAYPENGLNYSLIKQHKSIDLEGESIIKRFKYNFDPDFDFNAEYETTLTEYAEDLNQCIKNNRSTDPTRIDVPVIEVSDCYEDYERKIANTISSEVGAIKLLKNQGDYITPIETITVIEKNGVETVVNGEFSIYKIQEDNKVILPIKNFYLKRSVSRELFKGLKISKNSQGTFALDYDNDYELANTITLYSKHGQVLERLTKDGVYTAYLYGDESDSPALEAVNCRYNTIKDYKPESINETFIRNAIPNAMITTHKYHFPIGEYRTTDYRGRTTYTIYNSLGEVIGIKDHDKNLRAVNVRKRKLQVGTPNVVLTTEPNGDATLNAQAVSSASNINVYTNGDDMSKPVRFQIYSKPAYTYTVGYDGGAEEAITTNEFYHKFSTSGSHKVSVKSYSNGQVVENSEKTFTLDRKSMNVSYSVKSFVDGKYVNDFSMRSSMVQLYSTITGGTGEYTVTWSVNFLSENGDPNEFSTEIRQYTNSGSIDTFTSSANGIYRVSVSITDGHETFNKSWNFSITDGLEIREPDPL